MSASPGTQGPVTLRGAVPEDAPRIYKLKHEAFGARYLSYTIYRSAKTADYITALIAERDRANVFTVCEADGELFGYSHASCTGAEFFLRYIAVSRAARGYGIGNMLLAQFEDDARRCACTRLSLDVFESNSAVVRWYLAAGFVPVSESYLYLGPLQDIQLDSLSVEIEASALAVALAAERLVGFSKVSGTIGGAEVVVGLIDGTVCKLLGHASTTLESAISAVARTFANQRSEFMVASGQEAPRGCRNFISEKSLRLEKLL